MFGIYKKYINAKGEFYPCSFAEGHDMTPIGINVLESKNFLKDVWFSKETAYFRDELLKKNRHCPLYRI